MMTIDTISRARAFLGVGLLAGLLVLTGCDSQDLGDANPQTPTVTEIATEVEALGTFGQALQRAGPANVLTGSGPYTVFAPLNGAFEPGVSLEANPGVLQKVLRHHVVPEVDSAAQLRSFANSNETVSPLTGLPLSFQVIDRDNEGQDTLVVNQRIITNADVTAQEGIVHVVDGLLADAVDRATLTPQFTIFARLVKEAGLAPALRVSGDNDGRTIFAPTNEALLSLLDTNGNGEVDNNEIPDSIDGILRYHVHDNALTASDLPADTTISSLQGTDLILNAGDVVTVNPSNESASVTIPDVEVDNGVIHGIDAVLTP